MARRSSSKIPKIFTRPVMSKIFFDLRIRTDEVDRAAVLANALEAADEHAQPGRVDVANLLEIDDQIVVAAIDEFRDCVLHFR